MKAQRERREGECEVAGAVWVETGLVFTWADGYAKDSLGYSFSKITQEAGLGHTGVSIMSDNGVRIQDVGDVVGHESTRVTETAYRPVIALSVKGSASVLDTVFG